ncbi:hypothetical protein Tco_1498950 [Tanacetum coccineum]
MIAERKRFFVAQRAAEQRSKPPTKTQMRNRMCTYLKNMGEANYVNMQSRMVGRTCNIKRGQDTKIPQSGGPPIKVGDEAVHKELGDRMERAATTASSLEAEQDGGNINRTQSIETLNKPSP